MIFYYLTLPLLSILVAYLAGRKGRVAVLWALFTFAAGLVRPYFPLFVLLLILVMPDLKRLQPPAGARPPPPDNLPPDMPHPPVEVETFTVMGDGTWYVARDGAQAGPFPESDVVQKLKSNEITGDAYVWSKGMADWLKAREVGNFRQYC